MNNLQKKKRTKYNLNHISHDTTIEIIKSVLNKGIKIKNIYVDTVGPAITYQKKLSEAFPTSNVTVCPKADSLFPTVSAASVCAKVIRDFELNKFKFKENFKSLPSREFGCGYPSDEKTVGWLKKNRDQVFGFPSFVRFSWKTITDLEKELVVVHWPKSETEAKPFKSKKKRERDEDSERQTRHTNGMRTIFFTRAELDLANDL